MSSFEALRELRRVAGTQLDADYVEVLAGLLTGEGVEYRHADAADFDTELDMERRIKPGARGGLTRALWAAQRHARRCASEPRTSLRRQPGRLAYRPGQPLLTRRCWLRSADAALLERLQELLDLFNAEPALASGRPVRLEVSHVGPPTNRAERDPERIGGLRSGQTERTVPCLVHTCISDALTRVAAQLRSNCTTLARSARTSGSAASETCGVRR